MREWLSGGAPPCQGGGRGFDPRLALFLFANIVTYYKKHGILNAMLSLYIQLTL